MQEIFNKIKENKKRILHLLYQFVLVLIGTFVLAVANAFFLVPFSIVSGGISGIGIILADAGFLTVDIWQYILCWGLFFLGSLILGFKFTFNTLVSTIFYPIFLSILVRTPIGLNFVDLLYGVEGATQLVNGVLTIQAPLADAGRMLIIALFGGALVGVGCGITFIGGGSTGGIDIISFVLNKYTGFSIAASTFIIDAAVVVVGLILDIVLPGDFDMVVVNFLAGIVGIIGAFACSMAVDYVYSASNRSYVCDVVTSKPDELTEFVNKDLDRSTTIFKVTGGYTKEEKTLVRIVFARREYVKVKDALAKIDPDAFITYTQSQFVNGEGFKRNVSSKDNSISEISNLIKKIKNRKENDGK